MEPEEYMDLVADRAEVIDALTEEPLGLREVVDSVGASRSTVNRAVRALEDEGLVERTGDGYVATLAGRLALERYRAYRRDMADVRAAETALAPLPPDAPLDTDALGGSDVTLGDDATPYEPEERLHETVADADAYAAVLPALEDPKHLDGLYEHVVTDDDPATLVVDDDVFDHLTAEFPRRLAAMADTGRFEVLVGETPAFGLVVTDHGDERRVSVLVYGDGGVHAVLENDADHALAWADDVRARIESDAQDAADSVRQSADGGVVARQGATTAGAGGDLQVDLEREGFVRLSPAFFADRRVADPTTAWRAGLDLAEVHTGYAVARTLDGDGPADEADRALTDVLVDRLADGTDCAVVGPPGSGKSTTCKRVACEWYDEGRGPVFYREGGRGRAFDAVDALVATARDSDGHALVVVEDAVRPDATAVFDALDRLADRDDVSFLLDARESEWAEPTTPTGPECSIVTMPRLLGRNCDRLVEHVERTVNADVDIPIDRLRTEIREESRAGDEAAPSEVVLLLHRLSRYVDPLSSGETSLEEAVGAVYEDLQATGDLAVDVGLLVNLLNVAGVGITPAVVHALAPDDQLAVRSALSVLEDHVTFGVGTDGTYRVVHESWSAAFLDHLLEETDDAPERFGRCLSAVLSLATEEPRRAAVREATSDDATPDAVETDPGAWVEETVEQVFAAGLDNPRLALLYGPEAVTELPPVCSTEVDVYRTVWRGQMLRQAGHLDRAETAFERLEDRASGLEEPLATELELERVRGLFGVASDRSDPDAATEFADRYRELATGVDDERVQARASKLLGRAAFMRDEYERATDHLTGALDLYRELGVAVERAAVLNQLGTVAEKQGKFDTAQQRHEEALGLSREAGDRREEADSLYRLGIAEEKRSEIEAARQYYARGLDVAREVGDRRLECELQRHLGSVALRQRRFDDANDHLDRSLEVATAIDDQFEQVAARVERGRIEQIRGNFEAAASHFEAALEAVETFADDRLRSGVALVSQNLAIIRKAQGSLAEAKRHAQRGRDLADEIGRESQRIQCEALIADAERIQGNLDEAEATYGTALEVHRESDQPTRVAEGSEALCEIALARGNLDTAAEYASTILSAARSDDNLAAGHARRASVDRYRGDLEGALDRVQSAGADLDTAPHRTVELLVREVDLRRRLGHDVGDALTEAGECVAEAETFRAEPDVECERAKVARDSGDLDSAVEHAEAALESYRDADAALDEAKTRVLLADIARRRGDASEAADHLDEAERLAEESGFAVVAVDALRVRGHLARDRTATAQARSLFEESRDRAADLGLELKAAKARVGLARTAIEGDEGAEDCDPRDHLSTAIEQFRDAGAAPAALDAAEYAVEACLADDDRDAAVDWCETAIEVAREAGLDDRRSAFETRRADLQDAN